MSTRSITADVNPQILRWARESVGLAVSQVARRLPKISHWESGEASPTVRQLETLSDIYKRPLAAFFLPAPPTEPPPPTDFRVLASEEQRPLTKKVLLAIRRARRTQRLFAELSGELSVGRQTRLPRARVSDDPEARSTEVRRMLGIQLNDQFSWQDGYEAFRAWRAATEVVGVLVLQFPMPVKEARGFSLSSGPVPTIVVNSSDAILARIFTLFHELGHLVVNTGGVCIPDQTIPNEPSRQTEQFCNHFSGALLVPLSALQAQTELHVLPQSPDEIDDVFENASKRFKASRQVVLRRLLTADYATAQQFRRVMDRWKRAEAAVSVRRQRGGAKPAAQALSQLGTGFVSLVLEAHGRGIITASDVSDYLSVKVKHLPQVQQLLAVRARG